MIATWERTNHFLITVCNELAEFEVKTTNEIMLCQIINFPNIINIIYLNSELLFSFKQVINIDICHPIWIKTVSYNLSLTNLFLRGPIYFEKYAKTVSLGKSI
jgi:hypothetical protein